MLSSLGDMVSLNLSTSPSSHHTGLENQERYIMNMYIVTYIVSVHVHVYDYIFMKTRIYTLQKEVVVLT